VDYFIDLGAGWFLYEDESSRLSVVCDANAPQPNLHFGPASWKRQNGPVSGLTLLEAQPVAQGHWGQTGPEEWKWFSEDGQGFDQPPASWPRRIVLMDHCESPLLNDLSGRVVTNEAELAELLRGISSQQEQRVLPTTSAASRLAGAKRMYPHIFGD
jgi:hypothetical protein